MKTIIFCVLSITILLTTSCTEESLLAIEVNPSLAEHNEALTAIKDLDTRKIGWETSLEEGDTTIQLQHITATTYTATNELKVDYSGEFDFTGAVLESTQQLDFLNAQGNPVTLYFTVNDYTENNTDLEVIFALGSRDLTGWELKEAQQIVIEDVIVN